MQKNRNKAIEKRERYYFTGVECKHGHKSKRATVDGSCYQCRLDANNLKRITIQNLLNGDK